MSLARRFPSAFLFLLLAAGSFAVAQEEDDVVKPTWETQRHARLFTLGIPAPRGQITDRHGEVLAQTRVSYNLGILFPTPLEFGDAQILAFAREQIAKAEKLTGRTVSLEDEAILRHYRNRGLLPLDIATNLNADEQAAIRERGGDGLNLRGIYLRYYPHGTLASHILGYAGREGRTPDGPIQNNDLLWPDSEGRAGLEMTFNTQLTGKPGKVTYNFDANGHKVSEKISKAPQPGYNVVTTLDLKLQEICERVLAKGVKRGAMVFLDPNTGDILAMASYPTFDPNRFVPAISYAEFKALNEDKNTPLFPRAYGAAYPPGSIFKMFVAIAALEGGKITPTSEFSGPPSMQIGDRVFKNWKKTHSGMLNVSEALEESNDTWFYQVGIRTGSRLLVDWTTRFGFGAKTGIPLRGETEGRIPTDEYMLKVHKRRLLDGDLANFSIGQGDILTTPLQMAQSVGMIANGGSFFQTRLVKQVQSLNGKVVTGYDLRLRDEIFMDEKNLEAIRKGMEEVVYGNRATGRRAAAPNVRVAGKTGTAQWGPKSNERNAAWFVGYAPIDEPQYAFAAIYESDPGESAGGGAYAAPMIGQVLKELYKEKPKKKKKEKPETKEEPEAREAEENGEVPVAIPVTEPFHPENGDETP
ncbi:MAG TPA: penicillin-binding protein 2 [Chthoniobacteraceae bacterium]|nr:penicillin-binding protein 2 [Chthoniobacteraceae bacterium]